MATEKLIATPLMFSTFACGFTTLNARLKKLPSPLRIQGKGGAPQRCIEALDAKNIKRLLYWPLMVALLVLRLSAQDAQNPAGYSETQAKTIEELSTVYSTIAPHYNPDGYIKKGLSSDIDGQY